MLHSMVSGSFGVKGAVSRVTWRDQKGCWVGGMGWNLEDRE